jgi:TRAP transporter TAXI family solute receptor
MTAQRLRLLITGAVVAIAVLGWALVTILKPATQRTIVITAGADKGIYNGFAERYAPLLKREGITLDIRSSSGSVENYQRLKDPESEYEVGFIQSGTTTPSENDQLQTIAAISYEPIWVFYRGDAIVNRLAQLKGKRISIGVPGSGLLKVSRTLLGHSGISADNAKLLEMDAYQAYQNLENGQLDAAFFIGRPDAAMQQMLLNSDLKLMSFAQADALVLKFPSLSKIIFPRASTSVANDLPQADVTLLAATALLVSKDTLHPALVPAAGSRQYGPRPRRLFHPARHLPQPQYRRFPDFRRKHALFQIRPPLPATLPAVLASQLHRAAPADPAALHGAAVRPAAGAAAHG